MPKATTDERLKWPETGFNPGQNKDPEGVIVGIEVLIPRYAASLYLYGFDECPETLEEIKKHYKKLIMKFHPDKNKDNPQAQEIFQRLDALYKYLDNQSQYVLGGENLKKVQEAFKKVKEVSINDPGRFKRHTETIVLMPQSQPEPQADPSYAPPPSSDKYKRYSPDTDSQQKKHSEQKANFWQPDEESDEGYTASEPEPEPQQAPPEPPPAKEVKPDYEQIYFQNYIAALDSLKTVIDLPVSIEDMKIDMMPGVNAILVELCLKEIEELKEIIINSTIPDIRFYREATNNAEVYMRSHIFPNKELEETRELFMRTLEDEFLPNMERTLVPYINVLQNLHSNILNPTVNEPIAILQELQKAYQQIIEINNQIYKFYTHPLALSLKSVKFDINHKQDYLDQVIINFIDMYAHSRKNKELNLNLTRLTEHILINFDFQFAFVKNLNIGHADPVSKMIPDIYCRLFHIHSAVQFLHDLEELKIHTYIPRNLPAQLSGLEHLKSITLNSAPNLAGVPIIPSLEKLIIQYSNLHQIPAEVFQMPKLQHIDFSLPFGSGGKMHFIPEELLAFAEIQEGKGIYLNVNLSGQSIQELPPGLISHTFQKLNVSNNAINLQGLRAVYPHLDKLYWLDVGNNPYEDELQRKTHYSPYFYGSKGNAPTSKDEEFNNDDPMDLDPPRDPNKPRA